MNDKVLKKTLRVLLLAVTALALAAAPSFAQTDLVALNAQATMPDTTVINMWGFFLDTGQACTDVPVWEVGPTIATTTAAGTLTVNLRNCLGEPVSFFVPGLRPTTTTGTPGRFTAEVPAAGSASYTFTLSRPGTFPYHSATDRIRTHVPMGLYGALVVDSAAGLAYSGVPYDQDFVLVFSEIDPNLNADPINFDGAKVVNWNPQYFLINGQVYDPANPPIDVTVSANVLLRFVNAGLETFAPTFGGGLYMDLIAEDGNLYPHPIEQYGLELTAGKTIDAMINAGAEGSYALYDRALHKGMLTYLQAGAAAGAPTAADDAYATNEDTPLVIASPGVLTNDTAGAGPGPLTASLVSNVSAGALTLNPDGSFDYTPNANFFGADQFTYVANDGGPNSNAATVTITVTPINDSPAAVADAYDVVVTTTLTVTAPGVLGNDSDPDGDTLTAALTGTPPPGVLNFNADGSFDYTPAGAAGAVETFDYEACDAQPLCSTATVSITVTGPPANIAPTANDDTTSTPRNTPLVNYNVVANDVDPDGTIDPTSVVITTGGTTQRGGTVVNNGDGTVTYSPPNPGFRGTDTFQYTVNDNDGATSNVATVSINVVR